jgi:hypothetical protein
MLPKIGSRLTEVVRLFLGLSSAGTRTKDEVMTRFLDVFEDLHFDKSPSEQC